MALNDIIKKAGRERYEKATEKKNRCIANNQPNTGLFSWDADLPHDIVDWIWYEGKGTNLEKLSVLFKVYEDIPCFTLLDEVYAFYKEFTSEEKKMFWDWAVDQLSRKHYIFSEPMEYTLWVDFFEDRETVEEAWNYLIKHEPNDLFLERLLKNSGPALFHLKEPLYEKLILDKKWHHFIFLSLLNSQFDLYGDIDKEKAKEILSRLDLPPDTEHLEKLIKELE